MTYLDERKAHDRWMLVSGAWIWVGVAFAMGYFTLMGTLVSPYFFAGLVALSPWVGMFLHGYVQAVRDYRRDYGGRSPQAR